MSRGRHAEAQIIAALKQIGLWKTEYHLHRPHRSQGCLTPNALRGNGRLRPFR